MADCLTLLDRLEQAKILSVDTETNGEDIRDGRGYLIGISIAGRVDGAIVADYFPFRHTLGGNLPTEVLHSVKALLESSTPKFFHNFKFDIVSLSTIGIDVRKGGMLYCSLKMAHLINENLFSYDLTKVAQFYLGKSAENAKDKSEELSKWIKTFGWASVPVEMMTPYAIQDAVLLYRLAEKLWPLFEAEGLFPYWHNHKRKFVDVIIGMEQRGVLIDKELCAEQINIGEKRLEEIKKELGGYSPSSPIDLEYLLIQKLGLPVYKLTAKGKPSFAKDAMAQYDEDLKTMDSPIADLIIEYRGWQGAISNNYRPYLTLLSPDGRLRPSYKLHGTRTGRMSCEKPNLQNIPRSSDKAWNGHMKQAFIPAPGYKLWEADYSQLELRLSTAYADETILKQVFLEGRDIFTEMSEMLGMSRQDTKTFVYSTQYGAGNRRIKNALHVSEARAKTIRENYFRTYSGFKLISDRAQGMALNYRKVKLWTGRYRHFLDPSKESHKALNSIIQGGAADIVEKVMVRLFNEIAVPSNGECNMLLQVHDSVVFEIKEGAEHFYRERILNLMEDIDTITAPESFNVKFHVDFKEWGK